MAFCQDNWPQQISTWQRLTSLLLWEVICTSNTNTIVNHSWRDKRIKAHSLIFPLFPLPFRDQSSYNKQLTVIFTDCFCPPRLELMLLATLTTNQILLVFTIQVPFTLLRYLCMKTIILTCYSHSLCNCTRYLYLQRGGYSKDRWNRMNY